MNIVRRLPIITLIILLLFSCEKSPTSSNPVSVTFPDTNLEALIREALEKPTGDIFDTDLLAITELVGTDLNIIDLTGIEYCVNLVFLRLKQNQITDITPLINNTGLDTKDFVDLQSNPLSDTSIDTYIPQLKTRGVFVYYDEPVMVVTFPDAEFEKLIREILEKPNGDITNLELATINNITKRSSTISDITGIEYCKNLTKLSLNQNNLTDISKIGQLRRLNYIVLYRNSVTSIDAVGGMNNLENLSIGHNNVTDINVLSTLPKLKYLSIGNNPITNLDIISGLTSLEYLSISTLNLTNLDLISNLINLTSIEARYDQVADISALSNLTKLKYIAMNNNLVSDISVLASLPNLDDVNFNDNNIADISIITSLLNATGIALGNNQVSDISSLSTGLDKIEYIAFRDNQISDIKALVDNTNIGDGDRIFLQRNPLSDKSINTYIPQLEARGVTVTQ